MPVYKTEGTPCGSSVDNACSNPDTCNGQGNCLSNDELEIDSDGDSEYKHPDLANSV